jgi:hypothetical protein
VILSLKEDNEKYINDQIHEKSLLFNDPKYTNIGTIFQEKARLIELRICDILYG